MSIALKKLELSNFRKHKKMEFSPADLGITSISAPNGFGKSTIVDSLSWVLFGTKPAGVSKASELINWDADVKKDKIFVRTVLQMDNGFMKVERKVVSKTGSVECRVWWKDTEEEPWPKYSDSVAGPGVSHSGPYIKKKLRMDEAGFLTAVLVQQKQVDTLISAKPKDRAEVIERMTGIEAISNALTKAKEEQNFLKKQAQLSSIDEGELDRNEAEYKKTIARGKKLYASLKKLKAEREEREQSSKELRAQLSEEDEKSQESKDLKEKLLKLEAEIDAKEENLESVSHDKDEAKKKLPKDEGSRSVDEIQEDLQKIEKEYISVRLSIKTFEKNLDEGKRKIREFEKTISSIEEDFSDPDKTLKEAKAKESRAKKAISNFERTLIEKESQISSLDGAIKTLIDDHGKCPTCLQEVSDLDSTVSVLEDQKRVLKKEMKKTSDRISNAEKALDETSSTIDELEEFFEVKESLKSISEGLPEISENLENASSEEIVLSKKKTILEKELKIAENQEDSRNRYESLLKRAQSLLDEIDRRKRQKIKVEKELSTLKVMSDRSLNALRKKTDSEHEKFQKVNEDYVDTRNEMRLVKKDSEYLLENINRMQKEFDKHQELLEAVEVASNSAQIIDEFRTDRMKTTLPTLEVYASDLLSRFTDGRLIELKLDSKFNARVKNSEGISCPVGLLSAGELSATALALRIAISMLFYNGGDQSLIILDEVLVSQDSVRVDLILDTIKDVCKGQVVIIAHNAGISSIADKVIDLTDPNMNAEVEIEDEENEDDEEVEEISKDA